LNEYARYSLNHWTIEKNYAEARKRTSSGSSGSSGRNSEVEFKEQE
jgi:hypothetical protein